MPKLGQPVAVQRQLEFKLADGIDWTILCYLDLETTRFTLPAAESHRVIDYKVKGSAISKWKADRDPQAGLYLAGRWLGGWPAQEFCFAQLLKPGKQRKQLAAALTTTTRTVGQMRSSLARIAQAASQIVGYYERYGPDRSWGPPTRPAGAAARATASTGRHAPEGPGSSDTGTPPRSSRGLQRDRPTLAHPSRGSPILLR